MSFLDRLKQLLSPGTGEEAAAEREEYGRAAGDDTQLEPPGSSRGYAGMETEKLVDDDLDELKPPPDPAP